MLSRSFRTLFNFPGFIESFGWNKGFACVIAHPLLFDLYYG